MTSANPDFGSAKIDQPATCQNNGQVTVSATPLAIDCMFTCWTENGEVVSTDNPYTFTLESDRNLVANFWEKKYIYEPIESLPSHISSNDIYVLGYQDGNNYYLHSSGTAAGKMKLSLYPANPVEYKFNDFGYAYNLVYAYCDNGDLSITTQGVSLSSFNPFDSTDPFALSITDGNISSAGSSGYTVCHNGNIITTHTGTSEGNLRFFKRIPLHYITLSVSPEETGTATATSGGETVQSAVEGTEITVSATPTEGYRFKNWTENGEVASTENPYTFTLTADRNLVANFYKPYDFSAICETGQTLYYRIIDAEQHWVSIVAPNSDNYLECYEGYTRPTGNISLPATVSHNEISYTVKAIGDCAFYFCSGLTGLLTIPNSVTNIGEGAFEGCSGFTGSLTIPNSVTNIGEGAFWNCLGFNGSLTIGSSVTNIGKEAFELCSGFTGSLTIPNSVTNIGEAAFFACSGFKGSLTIPNSVTSIGNQAFYGCSGFNGSLTIGNAVTSIGNSAFEGCSGFTGSLTIGNSVTNIGIRAFYHCSGLNGSLTIGCSVTSIEQYAFYGCSFTNIISKAQTAPSLASKIPNASGNVYIPAAASTLESYQNRWSGYDYIFIQYNREDYHFNGTGSEWNTAANWEENEVPFMPCHNVFVNADCIFDATGVNAVMHSVNVAAGKTLTIAEDKTLTADLIILENGAQLIDNGSVNCSDYTVKKEIAANGRASDVNWFTISSPLTASTALANVKGLIPTTVTATDYDLYRLDEKNGIWVNSKVNDNSNVIANPDFKTIDKGVGYIYHIENGTTLEFNGKINVGDVECNLTTGAAHGYNLIGNPFTQNIKLTDVRKGSADFADGFYVLSNENTWGTRLTDGEIKPLQGFLVQATVASGVTISKPGSGSKGERSDKKNDNIEIVVSNDNYKDNAFAVLGEGTGLNKLSHRNAEAPMLYIPQDGEDFAIAFMNEGVRVFPLNFKAMTTGRYDISVKATDDINHLILIDNMTGEKTNMLLEDCYSFVGSPADNENRFTVKLGVSNGSDDDEQFVYQYGNELIIDGEGLLQVFDVLGRVVISEEVHGQRVDVSKLTTGAYIVRLTGNEVKTQKIIVR
ncbi:MAG: leucine-rich repeat protein [Bacteroidia bacterium]|nr:leucine-rich repeat protein [Bacteroidia bacterium]